MSPNSLCHPEGPDRQPDKEQAGWQNDGPNDEEIRKMSSKEYNKIMMLLEGSHAANHPSIKRFRLQSAIEAACAHYGIPKKDYVDVWIDFFKNWRRA